MVPGPDYEYPGEQIDATTCQIAVVVEPDREVLLDWAKSCCCIGAYRDCDSPFTGWSPGRSVAVLAYMNDGSRDTFYYKLFDEDQYDVDAPAHGLPAPGARHWLPTWHKFLQLIFHWELEQQVVIASTSGGGVVGCSAMFFWLRSIAFRKFSSVHSPMLFGIALRACPALRMWH